jgi:hypothetical protein
MRGFTEEGFFRSSIEQHLLDIQQYPANLMAYSCKVPSYQVQDIKGNWNLGKLQPLSTVVET